MLYTVIIAPPQILMLKQILYYTTVIACFYDKRNKEQGGHTISIYNSGKMILRVTSSWVVLVDFRVITRTEQVGSHSERRGFSVYKGMGDSLPGWLVGWRTSLWLHVFGTYITCHTSSSTSAWVGSPNTWSGTFHCFLV